MKKRNSIISIVIGCIVFGAMMALHDTLSDIWMRAIVAGFAGAFGGLIILFARGKKEKATP